MLPVTLSPVGHPREDVRLLPMHTLTNASHGAPAPGPGPGMADPIPGLLTAGDPATGANPAREPLAHQAPEEPRVRGEGSAGRAGLGHLHGPLEIGPVRVRELRAVARLQRRAFSRRLAYGLGALCLLWALPSVTFLVARREGEVVGCGIGDIHVNQGRVINLATHPDARRQGVGRALLRALEDAFPAGSVVLVVEEDNAAARALYASSGYAHHRHSRDYYGRGRHGVWMEKVRPSDDPGPKPRPPVVRF